MASMAGVTDLGGGGRLAVKPFPMDGKKYDEVDVVEIKQLYCNVSFLKKLNPRTIWDCLQGRALLYMAVAHRHPSTLYF